MVLEVRIEGEITSATGAAVGKAMNEEPMIVRINSCGGDVFAAMDIYNALKQYKPGVTVYIEGLCASAATIIACAGHSIIAANGLYMIHNPMADLNGLYSSDELEKKINALDSISSAIATVYSQKTKKPASELYEMMFAETWLTATDAVAQGFVDEVGDFNAEVEHSDESVVINALPVRLSQFKNAAALREMGARRMTNVDLWAKLQEMFGGGKSEEIEALKAEIERLNVENERLKVEADAADRIAKLIKDNLTSGAARVTASSPSIDPKASAIESVLKYARGNKQ